MLDTFGMHPTHGPSPIGGVTSTRNVVSVSGGSAATPTSATIRQLKTTTNLRRSIGYGIRMALGTPRGDARNLEITAVIDGRSSGIGAMLAMRGGLCPVRFQYIPRP